MKLLMLLGALGLLATVLAWTKEDHEIFDLVSDLETSEGKGTTFYSWLDLAPSAGASQITKAYRRKSLELHPDKNAGVAGIHERFARLGVVTQILRSPEKRERYDFFYKNGVPKWRGTGYYYSRFRPTLVHVLGFLVVLTALFHRLVLALNYRRDAARVKYFTDAARAQAGANGRKKVKVPFVAGGDPGGPTLELTVDADGVYIANEDGEFTPIESLAQAPSMLETWPARLSKSLYARALQLTAPKAAAEAELLETTSSEETDSSSAPRAATATRKRKNVGKK